MGTEEGWEIDTVTLLAPFAVGVPGKRTFFLGIGDKNKWVRIWLEKEHLQALAEGIDQLVLLLSQKKIRLPEKEVFPLSDDIPLGLPSAELDVIQMNLGYDDQGRAKLEIGVEKSGAKEKNLLAVDCSVPLAQLKKLAGQARKICAAGRPLCPICGGPIDPTGHTCPEQN